MRWVSVYLHVLRTLFAMKTGVHFRDLIGVGLVDASWAARFRPELAARLRELLDKPKE